MNEAVSLVLGKTDAEKASDIRAKLLPVLEQAAVIIGQARAEGLIVGFTIAPDGFGRIRVGNIDITKPL